MRQQHINHYHLFQFDVLCASTIQGVKPKLLVVFLSVTSRWVRIGESVKGKCNKQHLGSYQHLWNCSWSMSDDGLKTGKSTKGKNKAGSKKELKPAQIEVELEEQVDNQKF